MKSKHIVILLITIFLVFSQKISSQTNILYFMKNVATRSELNPGFIPTQKWYISLPSPYIGLTTNSFTPTDFLKSVNGEMKTPFDTGGDAQSFLDALKPENYINIDTKINIFGFGFKAKKNYFSFGISQHLVSTAGIPYELPWLLINGLPQTNTTKNLDFKSLALDFSAYMEPSLGYSREILPNLTAGVKVKFLMGQLHSSINFTTLNLKGNYSSSVLTGDGTFDLYTPFEVPADVHGRPNTDLIKINAKSFSKLCGSGFSFDLGAVYNPINNLTLSFSATDLGSISWNNNNWTAELKSQTQFKNASFQLNGNGNESIMDSLNSAFNFAQKGNKKTSSITSHTRFGAEYSILKDKIGFGLLYDYRKNVYYSDGILTGSVNFRPISAINASVAYSLLNAQTSCLGVGIDFNLGPLTLYMASDCIPVSYADSYVPKTNYLNLQTGMIFAFGKTKKSVKK